MVEPHTVTGLIMSMPAKSDKKSLDGAGCCKNSDCTRKGTMSVFGPLYQCTSKPETFQGASEECGSNAFKCDCTDEEWTVVANTGVGQISSTLVTCTQHPVELKRHAKGDNETNYSDTLGCCDATQCQDKGQLSDAGDQNLKELKCPMDHQTQTTDQVINCAVGTEPCTCWHRQYKMNGNVMEEYQQCDMLPMGIVGVTANAQ